VTLFFILNLELFCFGARMQVPYLGIAFFVWAAIFNNAIIAQFWFYGNDLYRTETGERLFPVIAIDATLAAIRFAKIAENASDYSIMNTARQMLWLPTSREEKYKAKARRALWVPRVVLDLSFLRLRN
jgi:ATP/ADP translocase